MFQLKVSGSNYLRLTATVQDKDITNDAPVADLSDIPPSGRIIAIDPGTKRCGVAICDELRVTTRPLPHLVRKSWKTLLQNIKDLVSEFDAAALVVGLPLESDGSESPMSTEARRLARNFALSLEVPVALQDERVTSYEAKARLWDAGVSVKDSRQLADSEAASIILSDFLDRLSSVR